MNSSSKRAATLGGLIVLLCIAASAIFFRSSPETITPTADIQTAIISTEIDPTVFLPPSEISPTDDGIPSWAQVYFTDPNPPDNINNGIDKYVVAVIDQAVLSVDVASFDLNLPSVVNALVAASHDGVRVRVVLDGVNGEQQLPASKSPTGNAFNTIQTLTDAGIPFINGGRDHGYMHDKMIIVDGRILFLGSWNISYNDTFRNNNNLLEITDPTLIANYQAKFNELFVDQRFGNHAYLGAQTPQIYIGGVQVENYFSPVDHVMDKVIGYLQSAQSSVRFMVYTYTDADLATVMIDRYHLGVDVQGVIESRNSASGALVPLYCAGLPVRVDGNTYVMHHKVIIIDESIVITGSFNFTVGADTDNDDNIIVIHDPALAQLYLQEFDRVNSISNSPAGLSCTK